MMSRLPLEPKAEKFSFTTLHPRLSSRLYKHILRLFGRCMSARTGRRWSLVVLIKMSNSGRLSTRTPPIKVFVSASFTIGLHLLISMQVQSGRLLTLVHIRTLKMTDDVLSVRYSPNMKLLAVALLDSTVKVFYQDTLKFFLSLYGHKLPVLSMDISDDSKLIVTCSADKNVKIWGLDFGDCHKSIFAHEESVMQVAFEKDSHYFWTVGKDKMLKYWDGDKVNFVCDTSSRNHINSFWCSSRGFRSSKGTMGKCGHWR